MITDMFGNKRYKICFHTHTTMSDGRVTPKQCAEIYKAAGYDAIALTDHWKFGQEKELAGLKILSGCEYHFGGADTIEGVMHIVGVGMKFEPELFVGVSTRQQTIDRIHDAGGVAILAHPAWSLNTPEDVKDLKGFDGVEIYNSISGIACNLRPYSGDFVDTAANKGFYCPLLATDDAHFYEGDDETKSFIMVKCEELTTENVLEAVRKQEFYASQGPELHTRVEDGKMIIDCSPSVLIQVFSNMTYATGRVARGENLTHWEYEIRDIEKWLRVEVTDQEGKSAWSNLHLR